MKPQVKKMNLWRYAVTAPICVFFIATLGCTQAKNNQVDQSKPADKTEAQREVFTVVEKQPTYKGGMNAFYKYLASEMKYPQHAKASKSEGTIEVQFIIERNGSISDVSIIKGIGSGCDKEAVRVIEKASEFSAGAQRGRTVRVAMVMPITFQLNGTIVPGEAVSNNGELNVKAAYNNGVWSGTVLSPQGDKLPGTNIVVAGTNYGTVSGLDGTFSVTAEKEQELHISYVGYNRLVLKP